MVINFKLLSKIKVDEEIPAAKKMYIDNDFIDYKEKNSKCKKVRK